MKTCGFCNTQYADNEPKCPVCGSTLLKYDHGSNEAKAEYERIKSELERKRRLRSIILLAGVALIVVAIFVGIVSLVGYINSPERKLAKESNNLLSQAERQVFEGNYDEAYELLDSIDPSWDGYGKVEEARVQAVRKQLNDKIEEYQNAGDYKSIITLIRSNVEDINADPDIKPVYDDAVRKYVADTIDQVDVFLANGDYSSGRSLIHSAMSIVGEDATLNAKLTDLENGNINNNIDKYLADNDYAGVISYLKTIVDTYPQFISKLEEYTQFYIDDIVAQADAYLESKDYNSAKSVLNTAVSLVGKDAAITAKLTEIDNAEISATVDKYLKQDDYLGLVQYLNRIVSGNSSYGALLNQYRQTLKEQTLATAESYAGNRQFAEAIQTIKAVQSTYDCNEFRNKIEEYESCLPIDLADCYCLETSYGYGFDTGITPKEGIGGKHKDKFGNEYSNAICERSRSPGEEYIIFYLDKKYAVLEGVVAPWCCDANATGTLLIYCDEQLVYESPNIVSTTEPFNFRIDVTGCSQLKIVFNKISLSSWDEWGVLISATLS